MNRAPHVRRSPTAPRMGRMLDYRGRYNMAAQVEVIPIRQIDEACGRLPRKDVKYRFVIGMSHLRQAGIRRCLAIFKV